MSKTNERLQLSKVAKKASGWGWKLFPQSRKKKPLIKQWPEKATDDEAVIIAWNKQWPTCNFAVATGERSGIIVLDVDVKKNQPGLYSLAMLEKEHGEFKTFTVRTPSNGRHLYFKYPAGNGKIKNGELEQYPGIEIKGDGGGITLPGSFYESGAEYKMLDDREPTEWPEPAECPAWLIELLSASRVVKAVKQEGSGDIQDGERNSVLFAHAAKLRHSGLSKESALTALVKENKDRCNPPKPLTEVEGIVESAYKYKIGIEKSPPRTDTGNAERMVVMWGDGLRYCDTQKAWYVWNERYWERDRVRKIGCLAKITVREMYRQAAEIEDDTQRKALVDYARHCESKSKIANMIELLKPERPIAILEDQFDQNPFLLNVNNGTIDLKTGELQEHRKEDLITRLAPVDFDPAAECPRWLQFLDEIIGEKELVDTFLQQSIGYSLTADVSEEIFYILYGTGANGKSTFLEVIGTLLGDYGMCSAIEAFLAASNERQSNDLARLKNVRFVRTGEAQAGRSLAMNRIKLLTGRDTVSARFLYEEAVDFKPTCKIFLATNSLPVVKGVDKGSWRRLRVIPFTVQIPDAKQDPYLGKKLIEELPGILNWAVDGCLDWQRNQGEHSASGLCFPPAIEEATAEYKTNSDNLAEFLSAEYQPIAEAFVSVAVLYDDYKTWAVDCGEKPLSKQKLTIELQNRGYKKNHKRNGAFWKGLAVKTFLGECDET